MEASSYVPRTTSRFSAFEMILNPMAVKKQSVQTQRSISMHEMADLTSAAVGAKIVANDPSPAPQDATGSTVVEHTRSSKRIITNQQQTLRVEVDMPTSGDNNA